MPANTTTPAAEAMDAARGLLRTDEYVDAPSTTVHINRETALRIIRSRGWTVQTHTARPGPRRPGGTYESYIAPDGVRSWHLDEALTIALTADALENGEAR